MERVNCNIRSCEWNTRLGCGTVRPCPNGIKSQEERDREELERLRAERADFREVARLVAEITAKNEMLRQGIERLMAVHERAQLLRDALIWCSGADDFAPGGKARAGFERIVLPLIKTERPGEG